MSDQVFDPQVIQDAISPDIPPCTACESEEVLEREQGRHR